MNVAALETEAASRPVHGGHGGEAPAWQRALAFGTGLGIAILDRNIEAAIVRARPSGATLLDTTTIADFRSRPAAEWGAELMRFVAAAGETRLAATVLLPRDEVIVRTLALPGVADKDAAGAIELQIDSLHPWGDAEVIWGWSRAGRDNIVIGLTRKEVLEAWETLFAEAGIPIAAVTFSSAAIHTALRIWSAAPASLLCFATDSRGVTEVYGESDARAVFSAGFHMPAARALAIARSELRLPPTTEALELADALPPTGSAASVSSLAWAAALASSAPLVVRLANLLPPERRASRSSSKYILPGILSGLLVLLALIAFLIYPAIEQRRYLDALNTEAAKLQPTAQRAQNLEKQIATNRSRVAALDEFRRRPQTDLDVLNELTRLLPSQVWTNTIEIYPDSVVIAGEADQAAPLLKILDSSPLFEKSEFSLSVTRNSPQSETFRIKSMRRGREGRSTP